MSSGIGFARDAQIMANRNRDNLKNKSNFKRTYKNKIPKKKYQFNEATAEELENRRLQLLEESKKDQRIRMCVLSGIIVIVGVLFWWFLFL